MIWAFLIILLLLILLSVLMVRRSQKKSVSQRVLVDLGLAKGWSKEAEAPFYKWGWRKNVNERVWAERIVKNAFEKNNVWLAADDLKYFEDLCNRSAKGDKIDPNAVREQVVKIIERRGQVTNCATPIIKKIMFEVLNSTQPNAEKYLKQWGVRVGKSNPIGQLGVLRLRQLITNSGKAILGLQTPGFPIQNDKGETMYTLKGLDGWKHWLFACQDEIKKQKPSGTAEQKKALNYIVKRTLDGILQESIEDLHESSAFASELEASMSKAGFMVGSDQIERLVMYFYNWQFSDSVEFNRTDNRRIREFLLNENLSPLFRFQVFTKINPFYESLRTGFTQFPKNLIFYGASNDARHYAITEYSRHLATFINSISSLLGRGFLPPAMLAVEEVKIQDARRYWAKMKNRTDFERNADRDEKVHYRRDYIPELIEQQKDFSLFEREIDEEFANHYGWLINLNIDELMMEECAHLDKEMFRSYPRIQCPPDKNVDLAGKDEGAQKSRTQYFNSVLETIMKNPLLRASSSSLQSDDPDDGDDLAPL
ncbi:MAG: hypothetical protein GC154_19575 [bacterium]|nr:hypothetical protein [bacterium]